jgi:hypothetical protein
MILYRPNPRLLFYHLRIFPNMSDYTPPTGNNMASVFARIPRPQKVLGMDKIVVPTASTLRQAAEVTKVRAKETTSQIAQTMSNSDRKSHVLYPENLAQQKVFTPKDSDISQSEPLPNISTRPLGPVVTLGVLTQNNVRWVLRGQHGRNGLIMVKKVRHESGKREQDLIETFNHRNIAKLVHSSINEDGSINLALEYCRCTLAEILFVHLELEETQIQYVGRSVSWHSRLEYILTKLSRSLTH